MPPDQLKNFTNDLKKAQKTTLLIDTQPHHDKDACLEAARAVYDDGLPPGKTNLIYINALAEEYSGKFVLLDALLKELGQDLERFNKIQSGVMAAQGVFSGGYSIAGLLTGGLPGGLDSLLDNPLDYIAEKISDAMTDKVYEIVTDTLVKQGEIVSSSYSEYQLNFSSKAKGSFIDKTLNKLDRDLTLGEVFNLTESLLIDCSIMEDESKTSAAFCGKLLVIQDPVGLDTISLALLNHLFAVCKDQQDLPFSLSFLFLRTAPDPKTGEVAEMLTNQRTFALRYGMYETPDADYPNRLITPDLFVGRQQELAILKDEALAFYATEAPQQNYYHVVLGEPGMGKTRLVEKHHNEFRSSLIDQEKAQKKENKKIVALARKKEAFTLKLKLYCDNQLSADSGLSSLIGSLEKEIDRMALAYEQHENFFGRQLNKIKDQLLNKPEELIPLYKDFKKVKDALDKWRKGTAESIQQKSNQSKLLLSQERGNHKEAEFERMDHVISLLLHVVQKLKMPKRLELFIDDLQWIDEVSAEYILRLQNRSDIQVRTLATTRLSDSEAAIKGWQKHPDDNRHRLVLLQKLGYQGQSQWDAKHTIRIKPLDSQQVAQLIGMALATPRPELSNILAEEVSAFLSPDDSDSLSTLFTVETLNLLSDTKLYEGQANIKPVFEFEEGKAAFVDRTPAELKHDLQLIFNHLAKKYQASFDQELGGFNLASYAVMEERLRLIEQHLGKRYAHLLIFSHLSSSPFEPKLIQKFIYALAEAEELDASFREEMVQACGLIEDNELETLEEIYLLLDELERPRRHLIYGHRHKLVEIFLSATFKRITHQEFMGASQEAKRSLEYALRKVFHKVIDDHIKNHELNELDYRRRESSLEEANLWEALLEANRKNLHFLFELDSGIWADRYISALLYDSRDNDYWLNAGLYERALAALRKAYLINQEMYVDLYIKTLIDLAMFERDCITDTDNKNISNKLTIHLEEVLDLLRKNHAVNPGRWIKEYSLALGYLANHYKILGLLEKAIILYNEKLYILEDLHSVASDNWLAWDYANTLITKAIDIYCADEAIYFFEKAIGILGSLYSFSQKDFAFHYINGLSRVAAAYSRKGFHDKDIALRKELLDALRDLFIVNELTYGNAYIESLGAVAKFYYKENRQDEAFLLFEEMLKALRKLFQYNKYDSMGVHGWSETYLASLREVDTYYCNSGRYDKYIELQEESLQALRQLYNENPDYWVDDYLMMLSCLIVDYKAYGMLLEATALEKEFSKLAD